MTTYSISLDDVDLTLLPVRAGGYNNFLKREHFEFQILATEEDPPVHTNHPCHVCAIDVPAAFWSAHCASAKHRANVRLATAAAQRVSALITATPPPSLQPTGKFCESCTTLAGKDHEKTKEHRISVIHDRMLCDLVKIYTGDGDFDDKGNDIENGEALGDEDKKDNKDINVNIKDTSAEAVNTTIAEVNVNDNGTEESTITQDELPKENTVKKIDNETYIRLLNIPSFPKIKIQPFGDRILILINSEKINVPSDNFHSYHRLQSKVQCRVCYCTIDSVEEETHKLSMLHMKRIMQVVDDSHCIREIYANWSHCILCNQVIANKLVNDHKLAMYHCYKKTACTVRQEQTIGNVKKGGPVDNSAGISKPNQTMTPDEGKNTGVEAKNTTAQDKNTGGPSHYKNAFNHNEQVNNSNYATVYKKKENLKIEYPYEGTEFSTSVYCVLCKCHVPNKLSNRSGHLTGARHAYSMKNCKK